MPRAQLWHFVPVSEELSDGSGVFVGVGKKVHRKYGTLTSGSLERSENSDGAACLAVCLLM